MDAQKVLELEAQAYRILLEISQKQAEGQQLTKNLQGVEAQIVAEKAKPEEPKPADL